MIHSTAIIHPNAKVAADAEVGPYCVIEEGVEIGPGNVLGPYVHVAGLTRIGTGNRFHAGSVIGDYPQDLKYKGEPTPVQIGDNNVFREHVTVHRSTKPDQSTMIGSNNYLMASAHVGHNCTIGNHVIIANGALLGGHAVVQDKAFISGTALVHQFTRVGTLSIMQGGSGVSKDLPPYTIATGNNQICGLNIIGLRRAGFTPEMRLEIKRLYFLLFRSPQSLKQALQAAQSEFTSPTARALIDFVLSSKRGVCSDIRGRVATGSEEDLSDSVEE